MLRKFCLILWGLLALVSLAACDSSGGEATRPTPAATAALPTDTAAPSTPAPPTPIQESQATATVAPATSAPTATSAPQGNVIPRLSAGQPVTLTLIQMADATTGWAVGQSVNDPHDHVLHTTDGGTTWRDVTPPEPIDPAATLGQGATAFFLNADQGWLTYYDRVGAPPAQARVWSTHDAGQTWAVSEPLDISDAESYSPSDLVMLAGEPAGWLLVHAGVGLSHDYVYVFATTDGGLTWKRVVDPFQENLPTACGKTGMMFVDAQTGWVTGDCGGVVPGAPYLQATTDGGQTWQAVELPAPADTSDLFTNQNYYCGTYGLQFVAPQTGMLVVRCGDLNTLSAKAWLYTTADGGQTWSGNPLPATYNYFYTGSPSLFLDPSLGWVLADDASGGGQVFRTQDGGQTWTLVKKLTWVGTLDFVDAQTGWAIAKAGEAVALVSTSDGGNKWIEIKPQVAP